MANANPGVEPTQQDALSRIVIFAGGVRSGTTVFRKMLATHPAIVDRGEVFNANHPRGFFLYCRERIIQDPALIFPEHQGKLFLAYLASLAPEKGKIALVDIKYEHMTLITNAWQLPFSFPLMLKLIQQNKMRLIHMRRQHFHSVVSNAIAKETGRYHKPANQEAALPEKRRVRLNRDQILGTMQTRKRIADAIDRRFPAKQRASVDYENVFDAQGDFCPEVCASMAGFLGLMDKFERSPALKKMIDEPLASLIENYDEIKDLEFLDLGA